MRRLTFGHGCEEFPSFSPNDQQIVYDGVDGPNSFIYRLDLTNDTLTPLTRVRGWDIAPRMSPAGDRITFLRVDDTGHTVYVAPLDGSTPPHTIASGSLIRPNWSRNGRGVWAGDAQSITEHDADTGVALRSFALSPKNAQSAHLIELVDGALLVEFGRTGDSQSGGLVILGGPGGERWLTHDDLDEVLVLAPGGHDAIGARTTAMNTEELIDVPLDGSPIREMPFGGSRIGKGLDISHDGQHVVWSTCRFAPDLVRLDAGSGGVSVIGDDELIPSALASIPRTRTVAIISELSGTPLPCIVDLAGQAPVRTIATGAVRARDIAVSSDGARFAISTVDDGIYVGRLIGGPELRRITTSPMDSSPSFRFGNKDVLFTRVLEDGQRRVMTVPIEGGSPTPFLEPGTSQAAPFLNEDRVAYLLKVGSAGDVPMLWDERTRGSRPLSKTLPAGAYQSLQPSPDGKRLAMSRNGQNIMELDVGTGAVLRAIAERESADSLTTATYSPDGMVALRVRWQGNLWDGRRDQRCSAMNRSSSMGREHAELRPVQECILERGAIRQKQVAQEINRGSMSGSRPGCDPRRSRRRR